MVTVATIFKTMGEVCLLHAGNVQRVSVVVWIEGFSTEGSLAMC